MKFLLAITQEGLLSQRREKIPKTNLLKIIGAFIVECGKDYSSC